MAKIKNKTALLDKPGRALKKKLNKVHPPSLEVELIQLIDDFAEFSDISAFLSHALATSLSSQEQLNHEIISGARICSLWLQSKTSQLKDDMRHIQKGFTQSKSESKADL